jgi:Tol biopolymer transport system component
MRFQIPPTIELSESGVVGLSPDGRLLAFMGLGSDRVLRLWIRALDSLDVRPLPGSEAAIGPPFAWSPDSRFIAFDTGGRIRKLDVSGGPPMTLCDVPGVAVGAAWNRDGDIIIGQAPGGLLRIRSTGGAASPLTVLDQSRKEDFHMMPSFLPDGRHFVYLRVSARSPETSGVYVGTLDAKPEQQNTERLMPYEVGVTYAPSTDSGPGRLLFVHEGTLMAQPFDAARRVLAGDRAALAERVGSFRDGGFFAVSDNDVLAYRTADTDFQLTWFDRQGAVVGRVSEPGRFRSLALSPDGTRVIVSRTDALDMAKADLWLLDLAHGGATRLTFGSGLAEYPIWSADGSRVFFTFNNENLYEKLASGEGSEERILRSPNSAGLLRASDWSRDGRFFVYSTAEASIKRRDIWVLPRDGKPVPFVRTEFDEEQGRFSPDGRWIAYVSNQSGASEVYVRAFTPEFGGGSAGAGGSFLVSRGGGSTPRWRADGKEIFYVGPDGKLMAVGVMPGQDFRMGSPLPLFQPPQGTIVGDASADGKRFLLATPVGASATAPFTVVLNWSVGLKK